MERKLFTAAMLVMSLALAFAATRLAALSKDVDRLAGHVSELEAKESTVLPAGRVVCASTHASLSSEDLRAVAGACAGAGAQPGSPLEEPARNEAEIAEAEAAAADAITNSNAVIDRAKTRGVWSRTDQGELNSALAHVPQEAIGPIVQRLARALNSGELRRTR